MMKRVMKTLVMVSLVILSSYFTSSCEKKEFEDIKGKIEDITKKKEKESKEEDKKKEENRKEEATPSGDSNSEQPKDDNQSGDNGNTEEKPNEENPKDNVTPEQPKEDNQSGDNSKTEEKPKEEKPNDNVTPKQPNEGSQEGNAGNTDNNPKEEKPKDNVTPEQPNEGNQQGNTNNGESKPKEEKPNDNETPKQPNEGNQQGNTNNGENKPKEEKPNDNETPNKPNEGNQNGGNGGVEKKPEENNPNNGSQPSQPNDGNQGGGNNQPSVPNAPDNTPKVPDNNNQPSQPDNNGQNNNIPNGENNNSKEITLDDLRSKLVVMDFTGQNCGACGYEFRDNISILEKDKEFSDNVYFVAIHGSWGNSRVLYNRYAARYSNYKNYRFLPYISFNNIKDNKVIHRYYLGEEVNAKRVLKTEVKATLTANNSLDITVVAKKIKNGGQLRAKKVNVLLWVLENDIESYQYFSGYERIKHRHVLRGYLNDMWGQAYNIGDTYTFKGEMLNTVTDTKNCEILAIIVDADTKEFIDAEKIKL